MSGVDPVEFGRVIGLLEAIRTEVQDLKTRHVWRLDNLETRVETLEQGSASKKPYWVFIEKGILVLVGVGLTVAMKVLP